MPIELFEMERMQSTWENLVDYDMSESGVRPLTLRELVAHGLRPRRRSSTSRSATASRTARSSCASGSRGSTPARRSRTSRSPTAPPKRTTSSRSASCGPATRGDGSPNYMQVPGVMRASARRFNVPAASGQGLGAGLGGVRARGHAGDPAALSLEPEQPDRIGAVRVVDAADCRALRAGRHEDPCRRGLPRR